LRSPPVITPEGDHMSSVNDIQIGGGHYKKRTVQHWDYACQLPYLDGQISKYVDRHQSKNGFQDLLKAEHYLHKAMEYYYPIEYADHLEKTNEEKIFAPPAPPKKASNF
jgi:hypothetical protein